MFLASWFITCMPWIRAPGLALNQAMEAVLALFLFTSFAQLAHVLN